MQSRARQILHKQTNKRDESVFRVRLRRRTEYRALLSASALYSIHELVAAPIALIMAMYRRSSDGPSNGKAAQAAVESRTTTVNICVHAHRHANSFCNLEVMSTLDLSMAPSEPPIELHLPFAQTHNSEFVFDRSASSEEAST